MTGTSFQRATFTPKVGPEVFLLILESKEGAPPLSWPAELRCKAGVATTSQGPLVFFLWSIWDRAKRIVSYEQFLNPMHGESSQLLCELASQRFLKAVMVDSRNGDVLDIVQLENVFVGDQVANAVRTLPVAFDADFHRAIEEFTRENSVEELLEGE